LADYLLKRADMIDEERIKKRELEIKAKIEAKAKREAEK
jgi:hypothetical protein